MTINLEVETKVGRQSVAATVVRPGVAVSNDKIALPNAVLNYAVLHVGSGEFVATAPKKRQAMRIVEAIAPLADWTQSVDALRAVPLLARRVRHAVWDALGQTPPVHAQKEPDNG
jgi:hypothetical protein